MPAQDKVVRFEQALLPHLDAAFNLARWLTRNQQDAEDVVQEAYLRALTFFDSFHGEDGRGWLLTIVRNTCYTWLRKNRPAWLEEGFDEGRLEAESGAPDPEALRIANAGRERVHQALSELPAEYREVQVLREMEELSYKQISSIVGVPLGTVMSRLARARKRLGQLLGSGE